MEIVLLLLIYPHNRIQWSLCWGRTAGSHFCSLLCFLCLISIRRGAKFPSLFLHCLYNFELLRFPHVPDIVESRSEDLYANLTVQKIRA